MILKIGGATVFRSDFEQINGKVQEELQKEIEGNAYTIQVYWGDTEEWKEANAKLEEKKRELSRRIELSLGFGELRGDWAITKKIKYGNRMEKQGDKES